MRRVAKALVTIVLYHQMLFWGLLVFVGHMLTRPFTFPWDPGRRVPLPPRRKMTIEYVLLGELNDADEDAQRLCTLLKGLPVRVNIIPWNPFHGPKYKRPGDERVRSFQRILKRRGLTVTVRTTKGLDIDAACGQLGERAN